MKKAEGVYMSLFLSTAPGQLGAGQRGFRMSCTEGQARSGAGPVDLRLRSKLPRRTSAKAEGFEWRAGARVCVGEGESGLASRGGRRAGMGCVWAAS